MGINMKERVEADKEIKAYLDTTNKSEEEKRSILEKCWKDDATRDKWLKEARANKPKEDKKDGDDKAAASSDERHGAINDIKKSLIIDAQIKAHGAISHAGIDPLVAVKDALSDAIEIAIQEGMAMARAQQRKQ